MVEPVTCGIVAGGESRRMGTNKALLPFRGTPLIVHQRDLLARIFERVVVAAGDPGPYAALGLEVVPDLLSERSALTALHAVLSASRTPGAFVVACDLPFLNPDLIRHLLAAWPGYDAVVPESDGRLEPLHACYSQVCLGPIEEAAREGRWKADDWLSRVRTRRVPVRVDEWRVDGRSPFFNANSPADWEAAGEAPPR
jgi:molybdopterin-guanine dinucleotide biosynthesis protein A